MTTEQKKLIKEADEILRKAGLSKNAQPSSQKSESIRAIGTPMGGENKYRLGCKRPS